MIVIDYGVCSSSQLAESIVTAPIYSSYGLSHDGDVIHVGRAHLAEG